MAEQSKPTTGGGYPPPQFGGYPPPPTGAGSSYGQFAPGGGSNGYPPPPQGQQTYAATGYPYPPPPPPPNQPYYPPPPSNYYYQGQGQGQGQGGTASSFFRRLIIFAIGLLIIFGVILLIVWLVLRPRAPEFTITSLSVATLNVSGYGQLTANWDVNVTVYNGNTKLDVYFDQVEAYVFYKGQMLGETSLPPFYEDKHASTTLNPRFTAESKYVGDGNGSQLLADRKTGAVYFNVRFWTLVRFKSGGWAWRRRALRVFCDNLKVVWVGAATDNNNNSTGTIKGPSSCSVDA